MSKLYFTQSLSNPDIIVVIIHGEKGYNETDIVDMKHALKMNALQHIGEADVEAAIACSMSGNWDRFPQIATQINARWEEAASKRERIRQ